MIRLTALASFLLLFARADDPAKSAQGELKRLSKTWNTASSSGTVRTSPPRSKRLCGNGIVSGFDPGPCPHEHFFGENADRNPPRIGAGASAAGESS